MLFFYKKILLLLFLQISFSTIAQNIEIDEIKLTKNIRSINDIAIEGDSIVWIATNNGLFSYKNDGDIHKYRDPEQTDKFKVNTIAISKDGTKWLGTYNSSVIRFTGDIHDQEISFFHITSNDQLVTDLAIEKSNEHATDSNLWVTTSDGLIIKIGIEKPDLQNTKGVSKSIIHSLFIDSIGYKWICTPEGMFYNPKGFEWLDVNGVTTAYGIYEHNNKIWAIGRGKNNQAALLLLFETRTTIRKRLNFIWKEFILNEVPNKFARFYDLSFDKDEQTVWIASDDGLIHYNPFSAKASVIDISKHTSNKYSVVHKIAVQNENTIWVSSFHRLYKVTYTK